MALGLALVACSKDEPATPAPAASARAQPAGPTAEEVAAQQAAEAAKAALANLSVDELRTRGSQALREQRLYAPAGDSAMEYYLALREKSEKPDASAESALIDLMPYAIIAAEQAIGREDFAEAERLRALIAKTDAQAPALPRITDAIAKGQAGAADRVAQEAAREEQRIRDAEAAAQRAAAEAAAAAAAPATPAPAPAQPHARAGDPPPVAAQPTPAPARPRPPPPVGRHRRPRLARQLHPGRRAHAAADLPARGRPFGRHRRSHRRDQHRRQRQRHRRARDPRAAARPVRPRGAHHRARLAVRADGRPATLTRTFTFRP